MFEWFRELETKLKKGWIKLEKSLDFKNQPRNIFQK